MKLHSTAALWVARVCAAAFWAVGAAYMIDYELAREEPNLVVLYSTPVVTAAVLAMPALAYWAWRAWRPLAALALALAAIVGSTWILSGTVSRQSEARDTRVAAAHQAVVDRTRVEARRKEAETNLAEAQAALLRECKTGRGDRCKGIETAIATHKGTIAGYNRELSEMGKVQTPRAGERRISAALAIVFGKTAHEFDEAVELLFPALFGLTTELGALATAMLGHSAPTTPQVKRGRLARLRNRIAGWIAAPTATPATGQETGHQEPSGTAQPIDPPRRRSDDGTDGGTIADRPKPKLSPPDGRREQVLASLLTDLAMGRTIPSQRTLCTAHNVPRSTMSNWLIAWEQEGLIPPRTKVGRCKMLQTA